MAHFKKFPLEILDSVALKAASFLAITEKQNDALGGSPIGIGESIEIWGLSANSIINQINDLGSLAKKTGRWYHQIKNAEVVKGYMETQPLGPNPEDWEILGVFRSKVANYIEDAIHWIDENIEDDDTEVRILDLPSYDTFAFWLVGNKSQKIVVITAPDEYGFKLGSKIYSPKKFLDTLRSHRHIQGIED